MRIIIPFWKPSILVSKGIGHFHLIWTGPLFYSMPAVISAPSPPPFSLSFSFNCSELCNRINLESLIRISVWMAKTETNIHKHSISRFEEPIYVIDAENYKVLQLGESQSQPSPHPTSHLPIRDFHHPAQTSQTFHPPSNSKDAHQFVPLCQHGERQRSASPSSSFPSASARTYSFPDATDSQQTSSSIDIHQ